MARAQLWTKDFIVGICLNLAMSMVFYLLMTSMAGYAIARFSAGQAAAGFASSSFIVGAVVARVLTGKYLDFIGRRKLLVISMAVFVLASLAYIAADTLALLIVIRLIHGVAFGAGNTAIMTAIQSVIPSSRRGEGTGYFGTATTLSTALGPYLGVLLPHEFDYTVLFMASAFMSAVSLILCFFLDLPKQELSEAQRAAKWHLHPRTLVDRDGLRIADHAHRRRRVRRGTRLPRRLCRGERRARCGLTVLHRLRGRLARGQALRRPDPGRYGDNIVIYPSLALNAAGNVLLAMWPTTAGIVAAGVLIGFGFGSLMPSAQTITVKSVPMSRVPVATASFFLLLDAGSGIGPIVLGALMPLTGGSGMFLLCAGLVLVSMLVYTAVHGRGRGGRPGREFIS